MPRALTTNFLSAETARQIVLRAQGLAITPDRPKTVDAVLRRTGAVQLDTISVLARSHELVAYARLGPVGRAAVEEAYWSQPARAFEYYAHANCVLPVEMWPYFAFRRAQLGRGNWPPPAGRKVFDEVRARLRDGPVTASDLGGARDGQAGWWSWSDAKRAIEIMYLRGDVVCTTRRNWKRVYDLPERALPPDVLGRDVSVEEGYRYLVAEGARALGVGTARDIANYYRLTTSYIARSLDRKRLFQEAMAESGLVELQVEGWPEPAFAHASALKARPAKAYRTTLLSPFDSLIWADGSAVNGVLRERTKRVFGYDMSFEVYVPKEKRVHGYFTMPLLAGGKIAGHVASARDGRTLVARSVVLDDTSAQDDMATALREAASWVGCDDVRIERVKPRPLLAALKQALR
jgi:uncharacterized protein YcaQ